MALIRKFPLDPGLNFIGRRHLFLAFSALLVAASIAVTLVQGLNFGIDFRGGIVIEIRTAEPVDLNELRQRVNGPGIGEVKLQDRKSVGSGKGGSGRVNLGGRRFIKKKK